MSAVPNRIELGFGVLFEDLYSREGVVRLDDIFLSFLKDADANLAGRLGEARANPQFGSAKERSELIIEIAPHVEDFVGELFGVQSEVRALAARHNALAPLFAFKRKFIQKRALSGVTKEQAIAIDGPALAAELESLFGEPLTQLSFFEHVSRWLQNESEHAAHVQTAARYAAWAALSPAGIRKHHRDVVFKAAHKLDQQHLVPIEAIQLNGVTEEHFPESRWRNREGFKLTDAGMDLTEALDQAHYCIKCHHQAKDSCSSGLKEKSGEFKKSVFGITLAGCPLDEKISEMNVVKQEGSSIGALAIVTIDNPMAAATGHRICNDCMKSCIFQKQDPVDIPQVETRTLKDVLDLPWGFEIYSLLTRWNPLNFARPVPLAASGYKVLVVGLGPAGFTLAHYLMNDGHTVAGVDGSEDRAAAGGYFGRERVRESPFRLLRCATLARFTNRWMTAPWRASAAWPNTASRSAGTRIF